jgi:hypothetical protein
MQPRHRPETSESVMAEPFQGYRRSPRTFAADRICLAAGCTTRLSIYNGDSFCAAHGSMRDPAGVLTKARSQSRGATDRIDRCLAAEAS